jgi:drug/metabolite transporter (DMT)-like permease
VTRLRAGAGLAVGVLAMSWGAPLARMTAAAPLAVAMWRMALATALLAPIALRARSAAPVLRSGREAMAAGVCLGLHFGLWIPSLWLTSVSASVVLVATQPLFVLLLSPKLLGVAIRPRNLVSFAVALTGVALISWGDLRVSPAAMVGDLMAIGGAVAGAGYVVVGKRLRTRVPLGSYLTLVYGVSAACLAAAVAILGVPALPATRVAWLPLLGLAVGPTLTGHTLLNWALAHLEAYTVNLTLLAEPVLASLFAWAALGEAPPLRVLPGAALVIVGLLLEFTLGAGPVAASAAIERGPS